MTQFLQKYLMIFVLAAGLMPVALGQNLQLGGKIGMTQITGEHANDATMRTRGYAGLFANYSSRHMRLGIQLELNYRKTARIGEDIFQVPVTGVWGLDKKNMVRLHAGPYINIGRINRNPELNSSVYGLDWGLTSGVDVRLPVTKNLIFITDARVGCSLPSDHSQESVAKPTLKPNRSFSFSLSIGLAFRPRKHTVQKR